LKGIHPKVVRNLPESKNSSGELTQAMSNFKIVDIIPDKFSSVQVEVNSLAPVDPHIPASQAARL